MKLFAGSSHPKLAKGIVAELGVKLGKIELTQFPNKECRVWIKEKVKGETVYILQTLSDPVNDNLLELCLIVNAAKQAGAEKVIAIVPWLGYSPQDKMFRPGEPLSAKLIADMLEVSGINELITFDLHSPNNKPFFSIPVHELSAMHLFINHFDKKDTSDFVAVSLDKGAEQRAKAFSQALKVPLILPEKERDKATGEVTFKALNTSVDLKGKTVISFDDFVSTGGTRIGMAKMLKRKGAERYIDCVTHLFPVPETYKRLKESVIDEIYVTDTIPVLKGFRKMRVLSVAKMLAEKTRGPSFI